RVVLRPRHPWKGRRTPMLLRGLQSEPAEEVATSFLVCSHTVARCTLNRLAIDRTLSPFSRAVRIESTCFDVRGVLARLLGFATTPGSSSAVPSGVSPTPSFARFHVELSRSNRRQVFGLSPP